jgi:CBS domain-containing protein
MRLDRLRARRLARRSIGPLLLGVGFVVTLGGNTLGGLAFVLAGWMARAAVRAGDRRDRLQGLLDGVTVADAMETAGPTVAPHVTLDAFVPELDLSPDVGAVRVVDGGALVGIVGPREVARVPRSRWSVVRAGEAMTATASLPGLVPDEPLGPAAERLGASGATGWPVVADGRPVGILTRTAVGRALQVRLQASLAGRGRGEPSGSAAAVPESVDARADGAEDEDEPPADRARLDGS